MFNFHTSFCKSLFAGLTEHFISIGDSSPRRWKLKVPVADLEGELETWGHKELTTTVFFQILQWIVPQNSLSYQKSALRGTTGTDPSASVDITNKRPEESMKCVYMCLKSYWRCPVLSLPVTLIHFSPYNSIQLHAGLIQIGSRHDVYQKSF